MFNKLIENYINNMNVNDVDKFARKNGIILKNEELNVIYETIKNNWQTIIYGDYTSVFNSIKDRISPSTYKKAEELFFYFKDKYQRFL